jgi:hypothetical protein
MVDETFLEGIKAPMVFFDLVEKVKLAKMMVETGRLSSTLAFLALATTETQRRR